jgi:hypothetical protein
MEEDLEYRLAAAERQREYCEEEMLRLYERMTQHDQTIVELKAALEKLKA